MTPIDKKKNPTKQTKAPPSADDSGSHLLLLDMKRSHTDPEPAAPAPEPSADDTMPPWNTDTVRRTQIEAWNNMAESMIDVVRTVRDSALQNERTVKRMQQLVVLVMLVVTGGGVITWYQGQLATSAITASQGAIQTQLAAANKRQEVILNVFVEIAKAHALSLEAITGIDPDKTIKAKLAAKKAADVALMIRHAELADGGVTPDDEPIME